MKFSPNCVTSIPSDRNELLNDLMKSSVSYSTAENSVDDSGSLKSILNETTAKFVQLQYVYMIEEKRRYRSTILLTAHP